MTESEMLPPVPTDADLPAGDPQSQSSPMRKRPFLAGMLSLFPGIGNIYNGLYLRGLMFFLLAVASIHLTASNGELWGFVVAFVWIFNVLDAWRQANLINLGYSTDLGVVDSPQGETALGKGSLIPGVLMIVFGTAAFLDLAFGIDLDWMIEFWPIYLIGAGAWLVVVALKARQEDLAPSEAEQRLSDEVDDHYDP
jgi:hypothetical protein